MNAADLGLRGRIRLDQTPCPRLPYFDGGVMTCGGQKGTVKLQIDDELVVRSQSVELRALPEVVQTNGVIIGTGSQMVPIWAEVAAKNLSLVAQHGHGTFPVTQVPDHAKARSVSGEQQCAIRVHSLRVNGAAVPSLGQQAFRGTYIIYC